MALADDERARYEQQYLANVAEEFRYVDERREYELTDVFAM